MSLIHNINLEGTKYEIGGYATKFFTYDSANGLMFGDNSSGTWNGFRSQHLTDAFNILDSSGNLLAKYQENGSRFTKDLSIGSRTGYNTGDDGVHLDADGFIQIQRSTTYHPYIGFYLNGSTSTADGQIRVNQSTGYMEFLQAKRYTFDYRVDVIGGGITTTHSVWTGGKTAANDGLNGSILHANGYLLLQRNDGTPYIGFYGKDQTSYGAYISYTVDNDYLNFSYATRYSFSARVDVNGVLSASNNLFVGNGSGYSSDRYIYMPWADENNHAIAYRASDGLTAYFGWSGSSTYATVSVLRARTVKYTNSAGTTTLSDERLKKDFTTLDEWDSFFDAIEPCAFRMKGGASGRFHIGFKAQQIEQALLDTGKSTKDFAGFIRMAYQPDADDPESNAVYEAAGIKAGDDEYGLIYTEFTALNTYQIQKLKARVKHLEELVEKLQA